MAKEIKKEKIKISKIKIAVIGLPLIILFFFMIFLTALNSLFLILLITSPFLFWKIIRHFNTSDETKSIISSLIKFWGIFVILLIVFYLFAQVIVKTLNIDTSGCPKQEDYPEGSIGRALYSLSMCASPLQFIGVLIMIILLHIPYLWITKFIGSRYLK